MTYIVRVCIIHVDVDVWAVVVVAQSLVPFTAIIARVICKLFVYHFKHETPLKLKLFVYHFKHETPLKLKLFVYHFKHETPLKLHVHVHVHVCKHVPMEHTCTCTCIAH